jgi:hypothetical protein
VHSRFRKGQSGNPAGRRKYTDSARGKQLLREEAFRLVTLREGDRTVRIPAIQAALRGLFVNAARGSASALKSALKINEELASEEPKLQNIQISWVSPGKLEPARMERRIVEPYPGLSRMSDTERAQFEQLLQKARKTDDPSD